MADNSNDGLEIKDSSGLTDADWAEINRLRAAYKTGGAEALDVALTEIVKKDPARALAVLCAFFPGAAREAIKDEMAVLGVTEEDLRDLIRKLEGSNRRH